MRLLLPLFLLALFSAVRMMAQCPNGLELGSNMVINGDFTSGNTDFTSEYTFCESANCITGQGLYAIGSNAAFYNAAFSGSDHTTGNGNFLIADGATTSGKKVWCQTVAIEPNSYYEIRFWVASVTSGSPAAIQFYIDGVPLLAPITAPSNPGNWVQYSGMFQSGLMYDTDICLVNTNTSSNGNNFGIDDISLKKCECALTINAGEDQSMCFGDTVQLDGSGSVAYFWSPQAGLSCFQCEDPQASPATTTDYIVSVNGPSGCIALDTVVVTVFPPFDLQAGPDTSICPGTEVQLFSAGAATYSWFPAESLSDPGIPDPVASPDLKTTYYLHAIDSHGCNQYDSTTVDVYEQQPASVSVSADTVICPFEKVYLDSEGAETYSWDPVEFLSCIDCEDPLSSPERTITYVVTGLDSNGCDAGRDSVTVEISQNCTYLVVPTAFSPNEDGRNDYFRAISQNVATFQLQVYNRWGQQIFSAASADSVWDGTWEGKAQPVGVYVWRLVATMTDGTSVVRNGNVTLVR